MNRDCCAYAAYYCEENVYHLACRIEPAEIPGCAVFVSNLRRTCAMTAQRRGGAVVWDYHVIYVADIDGPMVYDLDTILPFPVDLDRYLAESFPPSAPPPYRPMFRAVATPTFLREFASDRRHMRRPTGATMRRLLRGHRFTASGGALSAGSSTSVEWGPGWWRTDRRFPPRWRAVLPRVVPAWARPKAPINLKTADRWPRPRRTPGGAARRG